MTSTLLGKLLAALAALLVVLSGVGLTLKHLQTEVDALKHPSSNLGAGFVNIETNVPNYVNGLGVGNVFTSMKQTLLGTGTSTNFWKNTTGRPLVVTYAELAMVSASSTNTNYIVSTSTYNVYLVATSTPFIPVSMFFSNPANNGSSTNIIGPWYIGTTTGSLNSPNNVASTTSTLSNNGLPTTRTIVVPDGSGLMTYIVQSNNNAGCGIFNGAPNSNCETSTSTNRGFNILTTIQYHSL